MTLDSFINSCNVWQGEFLLKVKVKGYLLHHVENRLVLVEPDVMIRYCHRLKNVNIKIDNLLQ